LKGAKKVPKGTLFFIGQNGQLYMRTGPYLEGDGKFMFGRIERRPGEADPTQGIAASPIAYVAPLAGRANAPPARRGCCC
jgi:hypothetical protein